MNPNQEPAVPAPRSRVPRLTRLMIALALGVGAIGIVWSLTLPVPKPAAPGAVPVNVGMATRRDLPIWLSAVGTVQPLNTVDVKVRVDGQLQRVAFTEGQEIHAGALLAQIDARPFQAQLRQVEANRQKDQALLDNTRVDVARYSKLAEVGAATTQNLDTSKAQLAAQQAALAADLAQVEAARLQLGYVTIAAPISGRAGMRTVDVGAMVHASDATGLVTITQMQPITVLFSLPQDALSDILNEQGKSALPVTIDSRNGGRTLAQGRLVFIDSQVDQSNGQIRLKAAFGNENRALWPGQLTTARLLLRTERDVTVVPSRAIGSGQNGNYVYVVKPDQTVSVRAVATGTSVAGFTEIKAGLQPQEQIVFDGQSRLGEGTRIKAQMVATTAAAATAGEQ